jgi:trehalose/maltose hydrolase-like predicted phosphorylase
LSSARTDWQYSLSPGSLSSNAYLGHVFWDTEMWMYPTLLILYPELAQSLLLYRRNRVPEAREKARSYGYNGVMFPCESGFSGLEVCPTWAPTRDYEQHFSGDIIFAVKQLYYVTEPKLWSPDWFEMVVGVAEFYLSRAKKRTRSTEKIAYDIDDVMSPDEDAGRVNNSIFTNAIAQATVEFSFELASTLNITLPPSWMAIANNLYMPFNASNNLHLAFENFVPHKVKQADVALLLYPLHWKGLTFDTAKNDLEYYEKVTTDKGPAMTWAIYCIGWLELLGKETPKSAQLFKQSYANVHDAYYVWMETPEGGAINFITGILLEFKHY